MRIVPIVEGHGEVESVRILIQRICEKYGHVYPEIAAPIKCRRDRFVRKPAELNRCVSLAALKLEGDGDGGILILMDADRDCPADLGPKLLAKAQQVRDDVKVAVVLANKEYEAWFLAGLPSLQGKRGLRTNLEIIQTPENIRGAKERLQACMTSGQYYSETIDQPALTAGLDLELTRRNSASFDKLVREIIKMVPEQ